MTGNPMTETDEIEDTRRPVLRSLWFQFHKWIGISLAIVLIPDFGTWTGTTGQLLFHHHHH